MKRLKALIKKQAGLTLIELLIALAITGIITGASTMIVFQVFDGEARSNNHLDAISRVQNAGRQISRDAGMAQSVYCPDEDDDFLIRLSWTDWEDNETYTVEYKITNAELWRDYYIGDDTEPTTSYHFEYVNCESPCPVDTELSFKLTATVGVGTQQISESRVYNIMPRPSI